MRILILSIMFLCSCNDHNESANEWYKSGLDKHLSGDYKGAIVDFDKVLELNPNDTGAYIFRGEDKYKLGDPLVPVCNWDATVQRL